MEEQLKDEIASYRANKHWLDTEAGLRAAMRMTLGIDLEEALGTTGGDRTRIVYRLRRLVERERIRGAGRHFAYDMNRHIALSRVLRLLMDAGTGPVVIRQMKTAPVGAEE